MSNNLRLIWMGLFIFSMSSISFANKPVLFYISNYSDKFIQLTYKECDILYGCTTTRDTLLSPLEINHTVELISLPGIPSFLIGSSAVEIDSTGMPKSDGANGSFQQGCYANPLGTLNLNITDNHITCSIGNFVK